MGNEGACAAVHQRIAYKSGSVHMEPVPVAPWAPTDVLRKLHALQSLLAARQHQMALTMSKSLLPVLHPHRTFQFHPRHCCLRPPVVRSVGCLPCGWLQTKIRTDCIHARCKLTDASFDALVIQHRCLLLCCPSYLVAMCQPVILSYSVLAHFTHILCCSIR